MCGLSWDKHTEVTELRGEKLKEPTVELCIELLKAELSKRPRFASMIGGTPASSGTYALGTWH
jgi:hypothetical protein